MDDAVTATSYTGGTNFINGASTNNEYTYDANGNLTKDLNKGISNIQYNSLNLPSVVTFSDGSTITYTYTYDGKKLRTVHVIGSTTTTTDYCGNVIYENGTAKKLLTDGGYVDLTTTTPTYYYYLTDHQGNNRAVISAVGSSVLETNHYYPFGGLFATSTNIQPYKYNGKELDTHKGLNLYDYGARHYDAALGRWHVVDPMAEKMGAWSPYGYCFNNPIKFVDEEGELPWLAALVGGAIDYGAQVAVNLYQGKSISESLTQVDMKSVVTSAAISATGVGLANVVSKGVKAVQVGKNMGKALQIVGDASVDATMSIASQVADDGEISAVEVGAAVVGGFFGNMKGNNVKTSKQNSDEGKLLHRQADHDRRVAGEYPRASRKERAEKSAEKANSYGDKSATATSTFISSSVEESFKQFNKEDN